VGLTTSSEGRDGLLRGLEQVLKGDGALRAQLASLLAKQLHANPAGGSATPRRCVCCLAPPPPSFTAESLVSLAVW